MRVAGAGPIGKLFAKITRRFPDHGNTPRTRHLVLNAIVDVDGDRARYVTERVADVQMVGDVSDHLNITL